MKKLWILTTVLLLAAGPAPAFAGADEDDSLSSGGQANSRGGISRGSGMNRSFDTNSNRGQQQKQANVGRSGDGMTGGDAYY